VMEAVSHPSRHESRDANDRRCGGPGWGEVEARSLHGRLGVRVELR
jgi:hypothetical protein